MPPIYRFNIGGSEKESKWGWHRATELLEAINNLLKERGKEEMSPQLLGETFSFVNPHQTDPSRPYRGESFLVIWQNGQLMSASIRPRTNWLESVVEGDHYIPAKVGLSLIEAIKKPFMSKLRRALN